MPSGDGGLAGWSTWGSLSGSVVGTVSSARGDFVGRLRGCVPWDTRVGACVGLLWEQLAQRGETSWEDSVGACRGTLGWALVGSGGSLSGSVMGTVSSLREDSAGKLRGKLCWCVPWDKDALFVRGRLCGKLCGCVPWDTRVGALACECTVFDY